MPPKNPRHHQPPPEPIRRKSPEELLREAVNGAAVGIMSAGFAAIDELTELGKNHLKKAIIRGVSPKK